MKCPNCGNEQLDGILECEKCQVIFSKFQEKETFKPKKSNKNFFTVVVCIIVIGILVVLGQKFLTKPKTNAGTISDNAPTDKILTISTGDEVDINNYIVKGSITIFDFYANWCGPCMEMAPKLEGLVNNNDNVVIRKINIGSWITPVAKQYQIGSIPNVRVYDKEGNLVGEPSYDINTISSYVEKAK